MSSTTGDDRPDLAEVWGRVPGDPKAVEFLTLKYEWLAARIARSKRVPPYFDREDVQSWAYSGLFDAIRKFKPDSGDGQLHEHFIGYATLRINGAILDGMKAPGQSWATRDVWRRVRAMNAAEELLSHTLGRPATRGEIAKYLGLPERDLPVLQQTVHLDAPFGEDDSSHSMEVLPEVETTEASAEVRDIAFRLAAKIVTLSPEDQALAAELFFHGRDVRSIVERSGAPLPRVRRLRAHMLLELRNRLQRA